MDRMCWCIRLGIYLAREYPQIGDRTEMFFYPSGLSQYEAVNGPAPEFTEQKFTTGKEPPIQLYYAEGFDFVGDFSRLIVVAEGGEREIFHIRAGVLVARLWGVTDLTEIHMVPSSYHECRISCLVSDPSTYGPRGELLDSKVQNITISLEKITDGNRVIRAGYIKEHTIDLLVLADM